MRIGRDKYIADQKAKKEAQPMSTEPAAEKSIAAPTANGHAHLLDLTDPAKWQMKIRLYIESLDGPQAEEWLDAFRVDYQVAGVCVRDSVYRRVTTRCYVCEKPFPDGKPAGEAGYYDADRIYIKVYCCHNAEYSELLMRCQRKEAAVAAWNEKADKAARQAQIDARSAARKEMPA
jgi:hypothetical protein